jgi:transposase
MELDFFKRLEWLERVVLAQAAAIAERDAKIAERDAKIAQLEKKIAELEAKLNINSTNSSKPPSTDPPWKKPKKNLNTNGKKGAQKGHAGTARELVPVQEVDEIIRCRPADTCECGGHMIVDEKNPERKQVFELPKIEPHITEYQVFSGCCSSCFIKRRGVLPTGTPPGMLGPRALATIALLSGKYHLSKRDIEELLCDYFGLSICVGTICNAEQQVSEALKTPYEEVVAAIKNEAVVAADETSHKVTGSRAWMWVALSATMAVFFARASRSKKVIQEILGLSFSGILISDRYNAYQWVPRRQLCWAHLIRDFNKLADAGGLAGRFACPILLYVQRMFSIWHRFKDGEITRPQLQDEMKPICEKIEKCLEEGKTVPLAGALCKRLIKLRPSLWSFIHNEGVEPTNNDAERTVRQYVIWRKTSFGTQGENGNRFVERILTTVGTCKRQNRGVFDYLVDLMNANLNGSSLPSLLSTEVR